MKAFTEILSGVIRVGPETDSYGKPFEYAVAFSVDGDVATVKALCSQDRGLTLTHCAAIRSEFRRLGLKMRWERCT